jgi:hypothetical protein
LFAAEIPRDDAGDERQCRGGGRERRHEHFRAEAGSHSRCAWNVRRARRSAPTSTIVPRARNRTVSRSPPRMRGRQGAFPRRRRTRVRHELDDQVVKLVLSDNWHLWSPPRGRLRRGGNAKGRRLEPGVTHHHNALAR